MLIDNSVGENPPPLPYRGASGPVVSRDEARRRFVAGMFRTKQPDAYIDRLTAASLAVPARDAVALLHYPVPRSYWREAILSTTVPVLYVVRPGLRGRPKTCCATGRNTELRCSPKLAMRCSSTMRSGSTSCWKFVETNVRT